MEALKELSKQAIIALVVVGIVFLIWPALTLAAAGGIAAGVIIGNWFPAVESRAERFIEKARNRF